MNNYIAYIQKTTPKVLTQVDRDKCSSTYGCCDRNFWHLKVRDFSSAILQQTGLAMALLYTIDFPENPFYNNTDMKDWAIASVNYWKKIQLKDGSFNEYYPNEHGFPPTAFSLYSACEIYKRLRMDDTSLLQSFEKTAKYLCQHIEEKACNQEIASITALYSCYSITKASWIIDGINRKLCRILALQSDEGWFSEYGGADIGYLSVSFDMLAEYYWMSKDTRVIKPLERILHFIKHFVHPDHTIGGEYGSRNTTYFLPNGLEVMIQLGNTDALAIKNYLLEEAEKPTFFLESVDDRYCSHYILHSFLRALEKEKPTKLLPGRLPLEEDIFRHFSDAGLLVYRKAACFCIVGARKGGIVKLYLGNHQAYLDCGYRVDYGNGVVAATNWQDPNYKISIISKDEIGISGQFNLVSLKTPTPFLHFGLRMASMLFGNSIISFLKKKIILVDKHTDITFNRNIKFYTNKLVIIDTVESPGFINLECAANFSLRHVASGKFYSASDICCRDRAIYKNIQKIIIEKSFDFSTEKLEVTYSRK